MIICVAQDKFYSSCAIFFNQKPKNNVYEI